MVSHAGLAGQGDMAGVQAMQPALIPAASGRERRTVALWAPCERVGRDLEGDAAVDLGGSIRSHGRR